jgi:RNA polymerase sigma-70 factor (ECF subfamily)
MSRPIDPDRWVDDHGDALHGYAMLRLRDADLAAEVVQETFLDALKGRSRFLGESSERTWLIGILKHKIIDQFRRRARRERGTGGDDPPDFDGEFFDERGAWKVPVGRWAELPDLAVERAEFWEVFRTCLAELPPNHAEVFTLSELEGLPGPEVCKILGITPTNLWARLHRARLQLRRSLEARWFGRETGGE